MTFSSKKNILLVLAIISALGMMVFGIANLYDDTEIDYSSMEHLALHQRYCDKGAETSSAIFIDIPRWENDTHYFLSPDCQFRNLDISDHTEISENKN